MQGNAPGSADGRIDGMLRATTWLDLGNRDPRLPPAFLIEFARDAFESSAFDRHAIAYPADLRKAVPKRQAEFLAGRLAARHAIERLGLVPATVGVGASREPLWQAGVAGSISHTQGLAAAVAVPASTVRGIGIDIEKVAQADALEAIRQMALTPDEQALLMRAGPDLAADVLVTTAFSAKESFFKGAFPTVGRYFDFSAVRVSHVEAASGRLELTLRETLCPELPEGRSFPLWFAFVSTDTVATSFVW